MRNTLCIYKSKKNMFNKGILGINARNIHYVKKFNPKKLIKLANNKIKTKNFLWERGIPVAKNYWIISSRKELLNFDFSLLPTTDFVVKPNKWSKGKGIYIVKTIKKTPLSTPLQNIEHAKNIENIENKKDEKNKKNKNTNISPIWQKRKKIKNFFKKYDNDTHEYLYKTWWKILSEQEFKRMLVDTLDGKNSTGIIKDKIMIEEKLLPSQQFKTFCEWGLADIRIIVFNLVPVAAMIRIPTKKSEGKANLAKGGIALKIDIGTGRVSYERKSIKKHFPETYENFKKINLEYREEILNLSSKIQYFVNLWYLALDWVITESWPKLLEINARAGLDIQKITKVKLEEALKKISGLKIKTPEKWIEVAKALFSSKKSGIAKQKILYLSQNGEIHNTKQSFWNINIKPNINRKLNYAGQEIINKQEENKLWDIKIPENWIIRKNIKLLLDENLPKNEIQIWTNISQDYLIKPLHKTIKIHNIIENTYLEENEREALISIDENLHKIGKKLILGNILKPINYLDELDKFLSHNKKYNPVFEYRRPKDETIEKIQEELLIIQKTLNTEIKSEMKKLFSEKSEELLYRTNLIKAYKKQDFKNILFYNQKIYWDFNDNLLNLAKEKSFESESKKEILGKILSSTEIRKDIEDHLAKKGINNVDIIISSTNLARISIVKSTIPKIKILEGAKIRKKELQAVMAHEIDTHLTRFVNAQHTPWKILQDGTWFYLKDEEGLAVRNAEKIYQEIGYNKNTMHKNYFLTHEAQKYNFAKIFDLVQFLYNDNNMENIFRKTLRLKKGITNTNIVNKWAINFKEKIYLDGFHHIEKNYIYTSDDKILQKEKEELKNKIYKWKIKLTEVKYIKEK